jgi:hypothetical protein
MRYGNLPPIIGTIVSSKLATLVELQTVLGVQDAYDLIEIISVDAHNHKVVNKPK